jgi:hypothetical protein
MTNKVVKVEGGWGNFKTKAIDVVSEVLEPMLRG